MSLHASELNPVIEAPSSSSATLLPRTSVLKFAIVKQLDTFLIFFHFVPDVQPYGNYSEMFMYNAAKNNDPSFCRDLNVSTTSHPIYNNNEAALNSSGYFSGHIKSQHRPNLLTRSSLCLEMTSVRDSTASGTILIQCVSKKTPCFG